MFGFGPVYPFFQVVWICLFEVVENFITQQTCTCSKSTVKTLEKCVKYVQV